MKKGGDDKPDARELWNSTYQETFAHYAKHPYILGPLASMTQEKDPKHNLFTLARYKFCAKMLIGKKQLLEVGCGDGFGFDIILQEVQPLLLTGIDFDEQLIQNNQKRFSEYSKVNFICQDVTESPPPDTYDAAICLDVIEHVCREGEKDFLDNIVDSLEKDAIFIIGTPNAAAERYASEGSKTTHINLKDAASLRGLMVERFGNVLLFSMNDEMVHTGFYPMAHYLFAIGVGVR